MNYQIEILEISASDVQQPRGDQEALEAFHARIDDARNKGLFRLTVVDVNGVAGTPQTQTLFSPFFLKDDEEARFNVLWQAMKRTKTMMVSRERNKTTAVNGN